MNYTKLKRPKIIGLSMLLVFSVFYGCQKESDQNLPKTSDGKAVIKMNIKDAVFEMESVVGPRAASHISKAQVQQIKLNQDINILAELVPDTLSEKQFARAASVSPLAPDTRYKVVVFEGTSSFESAQLVTERDYIYGREDETPELALDGGKDYWFIAYSVNSTIDLPDWYFPGIQTLAYANILVNGGKADFLHFIKKVRVQSNQTTNLDVVFKHKSSQVTVILDSRPVGAAISEIEGSSLFAGFDKLTIGLFSGENFYEHLAVSTSVNFPSQPGSLLKSDAVIYYPKENEIPEFRIASMKMGAGTTTTNIKISGFQIKPGIKYNLNITFTSSDTFGTYLGHPVARINGKVWKRLNEGVASFAVNPDIIHTRIWGKQWTWGYKDPIGEYNNLLPYLDFETKLIYKTQLDAWNLTPGSKIPSKNNVNDPCSAGFRVPTAAEYESLLEATRLSRIGVNWESIDINNATAAVILTSRRNPDVKLTFPAAGDRSQLTGLLQMYNVGGYYQTSNANTVMSSTQSIMFHFRETDLQPLWSAFKSTGMSIRCIADTTDPITID